MLTVWEFETLCRTIWPHHRLVSPNRNSTFSSRPWDRDGHFDDRRYLWENQKWKLLRRVTQWSNQNQFVPLEYGRLLSFFEVESLLLEPDPLVTLDDDDDDFDEPKLPDELDR